MSNYINNRALITGVNGQDGQYLAELLISKKYEVFGLDVSDDLLSSQKINYIKGSMAESNVLIPLITEIKPGSIYNLAAVSQVSESFKMPEETFEVNLLSVIRLLEIVRESEGRIKMLQAISSEIFGGKANSPYREDSALEPLSPYAISKEAAYHMVKVYRDAYNIFACNAILFNHTSSRHGQNFVVRKIIRGLVEIKLGKRTRIKLGDLNVVRDWGYAGDIVRAMVLMLENDKASDYVVGTGVPRKIKDIVDYVLKRLGLLYDSAVEIDPTLFRRNDPKAIYSDPAKIMRELGWKPEKKFEEVLDMMIEDEIQAQGG